MNYLMNVIIDELSQINNSEYNILIIISIVAVVTLFLRVILTLFYSSQRGLFKLSAKEIKEKEDIKVTKFALLNKIIKDFQKTGEKGIANIDVASLVKGHMAGLNFIGLNFSGLEKFISDFEIGIIGAGFIFAVITESPYIFGLFSILIFIVFRIFGLLFDFKTVKSKLEFELQNFVEREIGQFYIGDITSSIQQMKVELVSSISNQSNIMNMAVENMSVKLSDALISAMSEIRSGLEKSMDEFLKIGDKLDAPLDKWKETIEHAFDAQNQINTAAYTMAEAVQQFNHVSEKLQLGIDDFNKASLTKIESLKSASTGIETAAQSLLNEYESIRLMNEGLQKQMDYIAENQKLFEKTVQEYEHSLKLFTRDSAEAIGSILEHGMKSAYGDLIQEFKENIRIMTDKNTEIIVSMDKMFQDMADNSRHEMQVLINMKDQMDMYFNSTNRSE